MKFHSIGLPHSTAPCPINPNDAECQARFWQVSILKSLVWLDQGSNPWGSNLMTYQNRRQRLNTSPSHLDVARTEHSNNQPINQRNKHDQWKHARECSVSASLSTSVPVKALQNGDRDSSLEQARSPDMISSGHSSRWPRRKPANRNGIFSIILSHEPC